MTRSIKWHMAYNFLRRDRDQLFLLSPASHAGTSCSCASFSSIANSENRGALTDSSNCINTSRTRAPVRRFCLALTTSEILLARGASPGGTAGRSYRLPSHIVKPLLRWKLGSVMAGERPGLADAAQPRLPADSGKKATILGKVVTVLRRV